MTVALPRSVGTALRSGGSASALAADAFLEPVAPGTLELTVIGSAPAAPQPDSPGSGLLVRSTDTTLLLDCGTGVVARLRRLLDPTRLDAIVVSHFHADHFLDLVALRYLFPWEGIEQPRLAVHLPPGGRDRLVALARVISEDPSFFEQALDLHEYDPAAELPVGELRLAFIPSRHYVPAWGISVRAAEGPWLVYSADTGPNPALAEAARGADLLVIEATLASVSEDVAERGHLTLDEALATARDAQARSVLLTHLPSARRAAIRAAVAGHRPAVHVARPGLRLDLASTPRRRRSA
ncbi:MAG TPA: MBL fold metallo-hydrolase [Candidatus Limnocylindrales bacterium]